jgi:hypothetical protein
LDALAWLRENHSSSLVIIADSAILSHLSPLFDRKIYLSSETIGLEVGYSALLVRRVVTRSRVFGKSVKYFYTLCERLD